MSAVLLSPAQIAKATIQRLALERLEPTPENYARLWSACGGSVSGAGWAALVGRLARGLEGGGAQWSLEHRRSGLARVLEADGHDLNRLRERLSHLAAKWEVDGCRGDAVATPTAPDAAASAAAEPAADAPPSSAWSASSRLAQSLRVALDGDEARALGQSFAAHARRLAAGRADPAMLREMERDCVHAEQHFMRRARLQDELTRLAREMAEGLTELAEDESWARGQAEALRAQLGDDSAPSVRGVRAAGDLLAQTRQRQQSLKAERDGARHALKALVEGLSEEIVGVAGATGRFGDDMSAFTARLGQGAASQDELARWVHDIAGRSRAAQSEVHAAGERLAAGQAEAERLNTRVRELEVELQRLSDEVSTDALTQVANRRGLQAAFDAESARALREGAPLAVGLIDIDNFKRLNDELGHGAGDDALKALAAQVRATLRPTDHVARYGGEEFVVLLPGADVHRASETLTRVQRKLSAGLFMHEGREVFVTFSGGVAAWQPGEALDAVVERADSALYTAKRSGKNRTCIA